MRYESFARTSGMGKRLSCAAENAPTGLDILTLTFLISRSSLQGRLSATSSFASGIASVAVTPA